MADTARAAAPPAQRKPRASKATRWRAGVLILVHLLAAIHIGHWLSTGSTVSPFEPSESMDFAKNSIVNTGLVFFAVTIASTLLLGRWFCGWACHLVALQDLSRALLIKIGLRPRPLRSRWMGLVPMVAAGYMFLWPLIYRVWIGDSLAVQGTHFVSEGDEFWSTFTTSWLIAGGTFLVCGFIVVYFLGAKGFCTYACPYGGVFGVVDRVSPGRIRVTDACVQCGHCTLSCTSNVDVSREVHDYGMVVDPGCMKCMDCVSVCPENALHFGFGKPAALAKPVREKRRPAKKLPLVEEAVGLLSFAFAYFAYRGYRQEKDFLLSLGLAALFAFAAVLVVRLVRRSDVTVPGFGLKKGGQLRPAAWLLAAGTLSLGAFAVPYGVLPAIALARADFAWRALDGARSRTEATGSVERMSAEERAAAATLLSSALVVHERSQPLTQVNTDRVVWGSILTGDPEPLAGVLEDVLESDRASADFKFNASQVFLQIRQPKMAEDAVRRVLAEFPGHGRSVGFLVQALVSRGQIEEAEALVREAISMRPDDPNVILAQGTLRAVSGQGHADDPNVTLAQATLQVDSAWRALDGARSRTEATGSVEGMSAEERAAAATLLSSALIVHERSQSPTEVNTERVVWGSILTGDSEPLAGVLEDVLASDRASADFKFDVSLVFLQIGQPRMAEDSVRRVLAEFPGHGRSVGFLVQALGSRGQVDEAEAIVREAISVRPDDPTVIFAQATLRGVRGDLAGAVEDLQRVVAIEPFNGEARDQLWRMLNTLRRTDEAEAVLREGLELENAPQEWRAHLAQVLLLAGKRDEALVEARTLAGVDQSDPRMLQVATAILQQLGETAEADAVARRAAALAGGQQTNR